jgi:hypothetical protein
LQSARFATAVTHVLSRRSQSTQSCWIKYSAAFAASARERDVAGVAICSGAAREEALAVVFGTLGIDDEAAWSSARATWIRNGVRAVR